MLTGFKKRVKKPVTEAELQRRWWWRVIDTKDRRYDPTTHTIAAKTPLGRKWKQEVELAAWRYELAIRHARKDRFQPFPKADKRLRLLLQDVPPTSQAVSFCDLPKSQNFAFWDDQNWVALPRGYWNVRASEDAVAHALLEMFRQVRKARRIRRSRGPAGKRNRPVSWRWPELLDIAHFLRTPALNPSERKKLSEARKAAEKFHFRLVETLKDETRGF
jgi:hypothetical protein